jgi:hypothetical protein
VAVLLRLDTGLPSIMAYWLVGAMFASALRIVFSPMRGDIPDVTTILPYGLLICAPIVSMCLALRWFRDGDRFAQPTTRLAVIGNWRRMKVDEAKAHRLYGTSGIMVSLLVGILLNVPVRALEYLAIMPAIGAAAPQWLSSLHLMMSADVVLLSSLYVVAFAAALRRVPMFPRLLMLVWLVDIGMQLLIAQTAMATGVPGTVAPPLEALLSGNIKKVLISMALWLPYLLLSNRVNVTYRHRLAD